MSEYNRSDKENMIVDAYIDIRSLKDKVNELSDRLDMLSADIDTLTNSLSAFHKNLELTNKQILENISKDISKLIDDSISDLRKQVLEKEDRSKRKSFFSRLFK